MNNVPVLGTIGNREHLQASRPEDHTPFSATAWPNRLNGYVVTAIDLGNVRGLGQAIENGARAGRFPWLKYMNHSGQHLDSRDLDGDGKTWEEYPSSDHHVHLSIRSDWIDRSIGVFDPFGGGSMPADYSPYGQPPHFVGNRPDSVMLVDLWAQEMHGKSAYDAKSQSLRAAQLDRIEQAAKAAAARPGVEAAPVDIPALVEALRPVIRDEIRAAFADGGTPN